MKNKTLVYTQPEIIKDNHRFIRVEMPYEIERELIARYNLKYVRTGVPDYPNYHYYKNNELVMFCDADIGYKDYEKTYKHFNSWSDAIYLREDLLDWLNIKIEKPVYKKGSSMDLINRYLGKAIDDLFKRASKNDR